MGLILCILRSPHSLILATKSRHMDKHAHGPKSIHSPVIRNPVNGSIAPPSSSHWVAHGDEPVDVRAPDLPGGPQIVPST